MARINIDDKLHTDWRFNHLVQLYDGDRDRAIGALYRFWRLAFEFWEKDRQLIPLKVFHVQNLIPILESELGEVQGQGVYARGAAKYFDWIFANRNRSIGGKASAEARRLKYGTAQPGLAASMVESNKRSNKCSKTSSNTRRTLPNAPALAPAPAPALAQDQIQMPGRASRDAGDRVKRIGPGGREARFDDAYERFPRKVGRARGDRILAESLRDAPEEVPLISTAVGRYVDYCRNNSIEARYVLQWDSFAKEWRDWLRPDAGSCVISLTRSNGPPLTATDFDLREPRADVLSEDELALIARKVGFTEENLAKHRRRNKLSAKNLEPRKEHP